MKKNVGQLDSYGRITCGLFMVGWGVVKASPLMLGLGAMKVAEGTTRWCPMLHMLGISTTDLDEIFKKDFKGVKDFEFAKADNEVPDVTV